MNQNKIINTYIEINKEIDHNNLYNKITIKFSYLNKKTRLRAKKIEIKGK